MIVSIKSIEKRTDSPAEVFLIESVPHDWLFPQMVAVVHRGGAGTTAAGLRVGVATLIVPHSTDQHTWGRRVADLGVGPQPIPRKELTVERLARGREEAISSMEMQRLVTAVGECIRDEDGVTRAVEAINRILSHR
jgi:sterol 3beta-glucosyltransferase